MLYISRENGSDHQMISTQYDILPEVWQHTVSVSVFVSGFLVWVFFLRFFCEKVDVQFIRT